MSSVDEQHDIHSKNQGQDRGGAPERHAERASEERALRSCISDSSPTSEACDQSRNLLTYSQPRRDQLETVVNICRSDTQENDGSNPAGVTEMAEILPAMADSAPQHEAISPYSPPLHTLKDDSETIFSKRLF